MAGLPALRVFVPGDRVLPQRLASAAAPRPLRPGGARDFIRSGRPSGREQSLKMEYLYGLIIIVGLYVILATSFNLIIGYGGLVSIAHPVFFALGAYASAVVARDFAAAV